jgi:4-hydroxybenzoyl-CoA reductase subunit alpha
MSANEKQTVYLVNINVNGRPFSRGVKANATLQNFLRIDCGLTGTKKGCELGVCGACTVLLDGEAVNSCMVLAVEADGAEVMTIEGLHGRGGELHPLQKAFIKHGAVQCGYCTPGVLMAAYKLINDIPDPTVAEIKAALGGNLCRCTGYVKIIEAIRHWREFENTPLNTDGIHPPDQDRPDLAIVGKDRTRYDAPSKVAGRAVYTADILLPRMVFGKILVSPVPHGLIKNVDTSKAEALPGVLCVLTGKEVTDVKFGVSPARYDEHILAKDRVRYVGDEVAAVCAESEETAERAVALIEVEYEELPAVFDPFEAYEEGAPVIHPEEERFARNVNTKVDWDFGDVEAGFTEADLVKEMMFRGQRTYQAPIEPHCALARVERHGDKVTLWSSTQVPHYLHHMISRTLEIPMGKIRVIKPAVGGGFGGKAETTKLDLLSILFAQRFGRPVQMKYSRNEMFYHHRGRHAQHMWMKVGMTNGGKITAVQSRIFLDGGAYTSFGVVTAYYAGSMLPTLYHFPAYKYEGFRMFTNLPACGAFRGHGVPQPRFAFESLMDECATELGLDPIEVRLTNAMDPNTRTINDLDVLSCELKATLKQARTKSNWVEKRRPGALPRGPRLARGIGVGCGGFVSGAGYPIYRSNFPHSNAMIRVHEDGTAVTLFIAAADIGQGSDTILAQIAAEELGIGYEDVWMAPCDSTLSPIDLGAYSSRVTLMGGNAVRMAARDIKNKLGVFVGRQLGCDPPALTFRDRRIFIASGGSERAAMGWADAASKWFGANGPLVGTGCYQPPPKLGGAYKGAPVGTSPAYSFGTTVAEVEVDLETGKVRVVDVVDFHDSGTVINPTTFHGQVEGAVVMSLGETLMEEVIHEPDGRIRNPNLHEYLIPTIGEAPNIFSAAVESYEPRGPFGAKEVGEGATLPVLGAIANAIFDATGVRVTELPITPEKVLAGIRKGKAEGR